LWYSLHMRTRTLQAVYENGALRPVEPLHLREHQQVTLALVEDTGSIGERLDLAYLAAVEAEADAAVDISQVRAALAQIPGSLTKACIAERDES
jgi:predicted DNA-binding antitoxin AbrB/MazE fold protein